MATGLRSVNKQRRPALIDERAPAQRRPQQTGQPAAWIPSSKGRIGVLALLFSLILNLALTTTPAQAATITVTNTADSGAGSLRQAITNAAAGDTITFALPNPSTITLNTELVIGKNLTIQGPGAAALTISGANKTRLFFINPGAGGATSGPPATNPVVTIANLTLANGQALGTNGNYISPINNPNMGGGGGGGAGLGGAIFSNKSQLTIRGVIFSANRAQGGISGSSRLPSGNAAGFGGGGMGSPSVYGGSYGVDGGALGGRGGAVASSGGLQGPYPSGGVGPIGYPGGEGAGGGGGLPNRRSPGGVGGFGGGGGGGGGISDKFYGNAGGPGSAGGFGGGGGGGGGVYQAYGVVAGGAGGQFGGNGGRGGTMLTQGAPGGGGAGLGGAIFVRAGALTLIDSSFLNNNATGGRGFSEVFAGPGQGKGGAIFLQSTGTSLTMSGCATFSGNSAANAAGSTGDNHNIYGKSLTALPLCGTGGVAGAAVAADTGAVDAAQPVTVTALEAAPVVTDSVPVSVPVAVEVAPVVTDSVPVSVPVAVEVAPVVTDSVPVSVPVAVEVAPVVTDSVPVSVLVPIAVAPVITESVPVVAEAPAVTTTQNITPGDAGVAPVDANAPDSSGQNQQLFLPLITNLAGAALRSPGGIALLVLVGLVVVGGLMRRRRQRTKA